MPPEDIKPPRKRTLLTAATGAALLACVVVAYGFLQRAESKQEVVQWTDTQAIPTVAPGKSLNIFSDGDHFCSGLFPSARLIHRPRRSSRLRACPDLVSVVGNSAAKKLKLTIILTGHWILMISTSPAPA